MPGDLQGIFLRYQPLIGNLAGDVYNIYRPNYSIVDNTPQLIYESIPIFCDPNERKFAEPRLSGVSYYNCFLERSLIQSGDVIQQTTSDGVTPKLTIAHLMPMKAAQAFRTNRIGEFRDTEDHVVYSNVCFEYLGSGFPGSSMNSALEDSLRIPRQQIVIYSRTNLITLRMLLIETDGLATITDSYGNTIKYQKRWKIEQIDNLFPITVLTVSNALDS